MAEEKMSFESAVEKLEQVVRKLEQGDLSLEQALAEFQEGVELLKLCNQRLLEVEEKMNVLLDEYGEIKLVPYNDGDGVN